MPPCNSKTQMIRFAVLLLFCCAAPASSQTSRPDNYKNNFNRICKYSAHNVSKALFQNGIDDGYMFFFPLEANHVVVNRLGQPPYTACFGPGEALSLTLIQQGQKLPCGYSINRWGNFDYWEQHACDVLLRTNCYCFAVNRYLGSYCEPGYGSTGRPLPLPIYSCADAVAGTLADGAVAVDRETVFSSNPPADGSHFIALAVKPQADQRDTGDFHYWRLDADGTWSYKAGDTLSRNSYRNGSRIPLRSMELLETRGVYTEFCGFFQVWPDRHQLKGNGYFYSGLPGRYKLWRDMGINSTVTPLPNLTPAFLAAYRSYYADAGWEDIVAPGTITTEAGERPGFKPPHTYSVRPFHPTIASASSTSKPQS